MIAEATATACALVKGVRARKPSGVDAFLHAYDLGSDEGIAMMCLAEALLRIPDARTADELIADKLAGPDWSEKLGRSDSAFVNAATFSLLLTGKVLEGAQDRSDNWKAALGRAVGRLGEPVVRTAVREAMKILGRNFVFGRDIGEALKRAQPERRQAVAAGVRRLEPRFKHAAHGLAALWLRPDREEGIWQLGALAGAVEDLPVAQLAAAAQRDRAGADAAERKGDLAERAPAEYALRPLAIQLRAGVGQVRVRHD